MPQPIVSLTIKRGAIRGAFPLWSKALSLSPTIVPIFVPADTYFLFEENDRKT